MAPKQSWNFGFKDKKGFVFTLDVLIALVLVVGILFTSSYFINKKIQDPYISLQLMHIGSDFINLLDNQGYFNDINHDKIKSYLDTNLPSQYGMHIQNSGGSCVLDVQTDTLPSNKKIVSGKEFFISNGNFCSLKYEVWLK